MRPFVNVKLKGSSRSYKVARDSFKFHLPAAAAERDRSLKGAKKKKPKDRGPAITPRMTQVPPGGSVNECAYCGDTSATLTEDHVIPLCYGGRRGSMNVTMACYECNNAKGGAMIRGVASSECDDTVGVIVDWDAAREDVRVRRERAEARRVSRMVQS